MHLFKELLFVGAVLAAGSLAAQELIVYPNDNQSPDQQEQDEFQCYSWAKGQTGFDPMAPPTATAPPPAKGAPEGGVGKGAVRGAVTGTVVGAIAGDTKKGAKIGAASGALMGGMRRSDQRSREQAAQQQWEQEQVAQYTRARNNYNRAYSACLEGRGYTVR